MKNFLLILLGKGTKGVSTDDVFKSECYYDWIKLKNIPGGSEKSPEDLFVAGYDEEVNERQCVITNNAHVQQGIIALPTDNVGDSEEEYNAFLKRIQNTSIIFISFISLPSWSKNERDKIFNSTIRENANEQIKNAILSKMDKTSMRLFYTFDHNDFAVICDGIETKLDDYLDVLAEIRSITFAHKYQIVHDITTIYGYKSQVDSQDKINAVISVSGQNVVFDSNIEKLRSFATETIGRYDHLSEYAGITWNQLASMSNRLHGANVITSRVHIGCGRSDKPLYDYFKTTSMLFSNFKNKYEKKINDIDFDKLTELYKGEVAYIASIKVLLYEIGFAIDTTLQRGFSKYNGICYIESYLCFLDYIKEKTVNKYCELVKFRDEVKIDDKNAIEIANINADIEKLAEDLVDLSNSFYKSILTLDSSIMHSERRFIMSDPYQLALFDVPPKLIAYYTAIASQMAQTLNGDSKNRYVFLITPDIKKDIYVESITENTDIGNEINILVIHVNERSIYNVTETTKNIAHEISHHVGQDINLRNKRAIYFVKCYIAMLLDKSLIPELFFKELQIEYILTSISSFVDKIYDSVKSIILEKVLSNKENYYYMDKLQDSVHSTFIETLNKKGNIDNELYEIISQNLSPEFIRSYISNSELTFVDIADTNIENNPILHDFICKQVLENTYKKLYKYVNDSDKFKNDIKFIRFVFKEGYADIQMLQLTQSPNTDKDEIINDYAKSLENVINKADEIMRKRAVLNAFLNTDDYKELWDSNVVQNHLDYYKAYLTFICKQASCYFSEVKSKTHDASFNKVFDCSKNSMFKSCNLSEIINHVDSTIDSYIESML